MKTMKWKIAFCLFVISFFCHEINAALNVKGNGTVTSKEKSVTDFNRIKTEAGCDVIYEQSDADPYLQVTIDENLQEHVKVEIKDRMLTIGFKKGVKVESFTRFTVKINTKWLKEIRMNGNGNFALETPLTGDELVVKCNSHSLIELKKLVELGKLDLNVNSSANIVVNNVKVDKLECSITGSGSITLKEGTANVGTYSISSSGDIHAFGVAIPEVSCRVTGSGTAEIHPTDNLKANLVGSGNIRYKGPTAVQQKKVGKGTIEEVK